MAPLRSPRRWWRERVLAPIDGLYAFIDEDLDDLDVAPAPEVRSTALVQPLPIALDRPA